MSRGAVLVTGGAGYIGSHVVSALIEDGWRPTILDDLSTGRREAVPPGARFVQGDVGERALLDALLAEAAPAAVFHFAGSTSAPGSLAEPLRYYENNTGKSRGLIEAVLAAPSRPALVFSSSAAVYGAPSRARVDEDAPTRPINPYGMSKLMTEQMLADAARAHGLSYVALRYFNVAGAGARPRRGRCWRPRWRRCGASVTTCRSSAATTPPPTARACATTSTWRTSPVLTSRPCRSPGPRTRRGC